MDMCGILTTVAGFITHISTIVIAVADISLGYTDAVVTLEIVWSTAAMWAILLFIITSGAVTATIADSKACDAAPSRVSRADATCEVTRRTRSVSL